LALRRSRECRETGRPLVGGRERVERTVEGAVPLDGAPHAAAEPHHVVTRPADQRQRVGGNRSMAGHGDPRGERPSVSSAARSPFPLPSTTMVTAVLDEQVAGDRTRSAAATRSGRARGVCRTSPGMRDHDRLAAKPQRIGRHDRAVGHVGVGETRHPAPSPPPASTPIRRPRDSASSTPVETSDGRSRGPRPGAAQPRRSDDRMMVRQNQPPDRLARDGADDNVPTARLAPGCERIDYHHAVAGHYEAGVGASLRAPPVSPTTT